MSAGFCFVHACTSDNSIIHYQRMYKLIIFRSDIRFRLPIAPPFVTTKLNMVSVIFQSWTIATEDSASAFWALYMHSRVLWSVTWMELAPNSYLRRRVTASHAARISLQVYESIYVLWSWVVRENEVLHSLVSRIIRMAASYRYPC